MDLRKSFHRLGERWEPGEEQIDLLVKKTVLTFELLFHYWPRKGGMSIVLIGHCIKLYQIKEEEEEKGGIVFSSPTINPCLFSSAANTSSGNKRF